MDKDTQKPKAPQAVLTGVRKRQQIETTNKRIFLWVAIASVIVSISLVALQFLVKEFLFNQKIISAKNKANSTLISNIQTATQLKENVNKLIADENLGSVESLDENVETSNLKLILDAMPVSADSTGFANSLQKAVLPRSGVSIESLQTNSQISTDATGAPITADASATGGATPQQLPFAVTFGGNYQQVNDALSDIAKVIRPITVSRLEINATDSTLKVTVNGSTYYTPAKTVNVSKEQLKP